MESHAEFLRLVCLDDDLVRALREDWRSAPLDDADRAMLAFCEKLTLEPAKMTLADKEALIAAGFDDRGVFQIAGIASFFNYVNRMADALGVGRR